MGEPRCPLADAVRDILARLDLLDDPKAFSAPVRRLARGAKELSRDLAPSIERMECERAAAPVFWQMPDEHGGWWPVLMDEEDAKGVEGCRRVLVIPQGGDDAPR